MWLIIYVDICYQTSWRLEERVFVVSCKIKVGVCMHIKVYCRWQGWFDYVTAFCAHAMEPCSIHIYIHCTCMLHIVTYIKNIYSKRFEYMEVSC